MKPGVMKRASSLFAAVPVVSLMCPGQGQHVHWCLTNWSVVESLYPRLQGMNAWVRYAEKLSISGALGSINNMLRVTHSADRYCT